MERSDAGMTVVFGVVAARPAWAQSGSDIPSSLAPPLAGYDYLKRDVMIPMRDGVNCTP